MHLVANAGVSGPEDTSIRKDSARAGCVLLGRKVAARCRPARHSGPEIYALWAKSLGSGNGVAGTRAFVPAG